MKLLFILGGLGIGVLLGLVPKLDKPKPAIWIILFFTLFTGCIVLNLLPPAAANLSDAKLMTSNIPDYTCNMLATPITDSKTFDSTKNYWNIPVKDPNLKSQSAKLIFSGNKLPDELSKSNSSENNNYVFKVRWSKADSAFEYISTSYTNPIITFPYVPQLEERFRIMNFHVPVAWNAVMAYLVSMIFSILYLKKKNHEYDILAVSSALIGTIFCILATVTGMIWARFNWGSFWNWDPRETSIFILLLIYAAYFALRSAIEKEETRARLSAVYSIIAFITVPFLVFILPRITSGLHPGSADEGNSGPVLSSATEYLNPVMQAAFGLSLLCFTALFFWIFGLIARSKRIENEIREL